MTCSPSVAIWQPGGIGGQCAFPCNLTKKPSRSDVIPEQKRPAVRSYSLRLFITGENVERMKCWLFGRSADASFVVLGALSLLVGCAHANKRADSRWQKIESPGGVVWQSESDGWRAIVEPPRGRLTFLGRVDGRNLLRRPPDPTEPLEFGGHRVWLGPQEEWTPFWPPPANWEMMPANRITLRRPWELEVVSPSGAGSDVAITRRYRWAGPGILECTVLWTENLPAPRRSINIIQLAKNAIVFAEAKPTPGAPNGYAQLPIHGRPGTQQKFASPPQVQRQGRHLTLTRRPTTEKLGFSQQTLTARWPDAELALVPGKVHGIPQTSPEADYPSHVYLGGDGSPVVEIEQISPRLRPFLPGTPVGHTVRFELRDRTAKSTSTLRPDAN